MYLPLTTPPVWGRFNRSSLKSRNWFAPALIALLLVCLLAEVSTAEVVWLTLVLLILLTLCLLLLLTAFTEDDDEWTWLL